MPLSFESAFCMQPYEHEERDLDLEK